MITVQIPRPKLRIFKCTSFACSCDPDSRWVVDAGRIAYDAPTWHDALALALALARQDSRRRAAAVEAAC